MANNKEQALKGKKTIYLAGAIEKVSWEQATAWRNLTQEFLSEADQYYVINPLENKTKVDKYNYNPTTIVTNDLNNVSKADILIVENHFPSIPRWGTAMEVAYAYYNVPNKPDILVWGQENLGYFLKYHATHHWQTLEALLNFLRPAKLCKDDIYCLKPLPCSICNNPDEKFYTQRKTSTII